MITAASVKDLREKTGAGMMDCKKALTETGGDFEAAVDWLRTKGLSAAAKKAGRVAAEGLTAAAVDGTIGAIVEVNSETDFVARNDKFQGLVSSIAKLALKAGDVESLQKATMPSGRTAQEEIVEHIATIGENMGLRRVSVLKVEDGVVASYVHNAVADGLGKIAVIVALESTGDKAKLTSMGKQIAMHIAATRPQALNIESVDPEALKRERDIFFEQSRASGKPDNIIEKMVEGRIRKFYEESVLLEQVFVIDGKTKISEVVSNAAKELGAPVTLKAFARFELGEGIEQEVKDFAAEVAAAAGM
ncbi:MAG: translation elongation factor Ts [Pseudomonadota bacterium]